MDFSKKQIAIFYIEKDKGILYTTNSTMPFVVHFHKDVVNNLEVTDKSKLEQLFADYISKNELKPMNVFVVLSRDITLEKELKNVPLSLQSAETEKFLDMVLFHQILAKTYNFSNKTIIVTTNKDFCVNIIGAFSENLFPVIGVIPLSVLEEKFPQLTGKFDEKFVFKKIENLKRYFLPLGLEQYEKIITNSIPSFKNAQFIILLGVFVLLLVILGVQLYTQGFSSASKPDHVKSAVVEKTISAPTASPSATLSPEKTSL